MKRIRAIPRDAAQLHGVSRWLKRKLSECWRIIADDRGSVSAEFALLLPIIGAVIALCVAAVSLSSQQLRLTAAAADMARVEARGEAGPTDPSRMLGYSVTVARTLRGGVHCVRLSAYPGRGVLAAVAISAQSCALKSAHE